METKILSIPVTLILEHQDTGASYAANCINELLGPLRRPDLADSPLLEYVVGEVREHAIQGEEMDAYDEGDYRRAEPAVVAQTVAVKAPRASRTEPGWHEWSIAFRRDEGLQLDACGILSVVSTLPSADEVLTAVARATRQWAEFQRINFNDDVLRHVGASFNFGDLASHGAFDDRQFHVYLSGAGCFDVSFIGVNTDLTVSYETCLLALADDVEEPTPPDAVEDGPAAKQIYRLNSRADGSIEGVVWTNDDLDHGVPSEDATWDVRYASFDAMAKATGKSHIGISGVRVEVYLDGQKI
jgi:hypothetical protein